MPFLIEVLCLGQDRYASIEAPARDLNAIQREFVFLLTSPELRPKGLTFQRAQYNTQDVFQFLRDFRKEAKGDHPYLIAFLDAPLESDKLRHLFGSHEATEGLAVVTLYDSTQFVSETRRYILYYLVRYALSFLAPAIQAHTAPDRTSCFFHKKLRKLEILDSLNKGEVCDECRKALEPKLSPPIDTALKAMFALVADNYPHALIMKGGGPKGLAFVGALQELEKYYAFDRLVGTSAGAIAAVLLAAGLTPTELEVELRKRSFVRFLDLLVPLNVIRFRALFSGRPIRRWLEALLTAKLELNTVRMKDLLPRKATVFASVSGLGAMAFETDGERQDTDAAFAVSCSVAIPFVFAAQYVDGHKVYDGALAANFPLREYLERHGRKPFIALYLRPPAKRGWLRWLSLFDLIDVWLERDDQVLVDRYRENVVLIDPAPITTLSFVLSKAEKTYLVEQGRVAAVRFLAKTKSKEGPVPEAVQAAEREALRWRRKARRMKMLRWGAVALGLAVAGWIVL